MINSPLNARSTNKPKSKSLLFYLTLLLLFVLSLRDGWPWEEAQSCTAGAEDGPEQSRHRESCHCCGSKAFTKVLTLKPLFSVNVHIVLVQISFQIWAGSQLHVGFSHQRLSHVSALQNLCFHERGQQDLLYARSAHKHTGITAMCLYYGLCRHHLPFKKKKDISQQR